MSGGAYAGDVDVNEAWLRLAEEPGAQLVDVRTRAEWAFVGVPDLSTLAKEPILIEWQRYPGMEQNGEFVSAVSVELSTRKVSAGAVVFFLCRSGARSAAAAAAMTAAGRDPCFNIAGGFEGRLDVARHRGTVDGWKAAGLPWIQS